MEYTAEAEIVKPVESKQVAKSQLAWVKGDLHVDGVKADTLTLFHGMKNTKCEGYSYTRMREWKTNSDWDKCDEIISYLLGDLQPMTATGLVFKFLLTLADGTVRYCNAFDVAGIRRVR